MDNFESDFYCFLVLNLQYKWEVTLFILCFSVLIDIVFMCQFFFGSNYPSVNSILQRNSYLTVV